MGRWQTGVPVPTAGLGRPPLGPLVGSALARPLRSQTLLPRCLRSARSGAELRIPKRKLKRDFSEFSRSSPAFLFPHRSKYGATSVLPCLAFKARCSSRFTPARRRMTRDADGFSTAPAPQNGNRMLRAIDDRDTPYSSLRSPLRRVPCARSGRLWGGGSSAVRYEDGSKPRRSKTWRAGKACGAFAKIRSVPSSQCSVGRSLLPRRTDHSACEGQVGLCLGSLTLGPDALSEC